MTHVDEYPLAPEIARHVEALPEWADVNAPSFLNWAVEEIERLHGLVSAGETRERRFELQNQIATIEGAAYRYGQWLRERS